MTEDGLRRQYSGNSHDAFPYLHEKDPLADSVSSQSPQLPWNQIPVKVDELARILLFCGIVDLDK